jgi:hypothetical protein
MNEARVVFDRKVASVYDFKGKLVNTGTRPVDWAFARNVSRSKGYDIEENTVGNRRTVVLRTTENPSLSN